MTINDLLQKDAERVQKNAKPSETVTVTSDRMDIEMPRTRIHTLEQLVAHFQIDETIWHIARFVANKWEVAAKNDKGKLEVEPLYQVKAFCERRKDLALVHEEIAALKLLAAKAIRIKFPPIPKPKANGNLLEINMPDLHAGKLAWRPETGGPNYDTKIMVKTYWRAFNALLSRVAHLKIERIIFNVGNDLLNSDDTEGRTTGGTYVNTDVRYQKTFEVVRNLKIESIERLRQIAPVDVIMTRGNHDTLSTWHLGDSLEMYFHDCPDVQIDNRPRGRKYYQWGKCMVMFTHGHKGKRNDYPLVMATEEPKMFGATRFRECHTGHLHKKFVDEHHGVRVRIISALCPADAWHADNCFVGNLRCAEAFVWNKEEGIIASAEYTDWEEGE